MITKEQALARAKSLRWVVNQIPEDLGDSNEERILTCIRLYCKAGAETIEELCQSFQSRCNHCHKEMTPYTKTSGPHIGLYCPYCGKFQKWVSKQELVKMKLSEDNEDIPF